MSSSSTTPGKLKVVVTGGSGRIGSAVIRELVARGHAVTNIDRRAPHEPTPGVRFVYCDIRRREQVQPVLDGADAVAHLAEIPHSHAPYSGDEIFSHNVQAGSVVMQTAADLRLRHCIYTSSMQVYGHWGPPPQPAPRFLPMDETHPVQPTNVYSLSKVANETFAKLMADQHNLSVSVVRLPGTWGGDFNERWMRWMSADKDDGPVHELQTYVHATDVAVAYAEMVERAHPGCETYHLTAADVVSLVPLTERIRKHNPGLPPLPADWPPFRSPVLTTKARDKLGWEPRWSFLDQYAKWKGHDPRSQAVKG